jgi:hypothetical protein
MGTVFKKQTTRALPVGAEIVEKGGKRLARWRVRSKLRTVPVTTGEDGSQRIVTESATYYAKYRDHAGAVQVVPTKCRDRQAAERVLSDLEREAERIRAGVVTVPELDRAAHTRAPVQTAIDAYLTYMESAGQTPAHIAERKRQLARLVRDCGFGTLADLKREALEAWLVKQARAGMGPGPGTATSSPSPRSPTGAPTRT